MPAKPPFAVLFEMAIGRWVTSAICAAAKLGVADQLSSAPKTTTELAKQLNLHEDALYRLMRALASVGIFHEAEGRAFSQTPLSDLLRSNATPTLRDGALMFNDDWYNRCWAELPWSIQTGHRRPKKSSA